MNKNTTNYTGNKIRLLKLITLFVEIVLLIIMIHFLYNSALYKASDLASVIDVHLNQEYQEIFIVSEVIHENRNIIDNYVYFEQKYLAKSKNKEIVCQITGRVISNNFYNVTNISFDDGIKKKEIKLTSIDSVKNTSINLIEAFILIDLIIYYIMTRRYRRRNIDILYKK